MSRTQLTTLVASVTLALAACNGDKGDPLEEDAEAIETEALGSFTTNADELTGDIAFTVPDGASSAAVYCGPYGDSLLATAWVITDPSGNQFYANEYHESYTEAPMRVGNHDDMLPVLLPVSPDADLSAGTWTMDVWVASSSPVTVDCEAVYRVADVSNNAVVDLDLVFVGLDDLGIDASSAPDDDDFQQVLATLDDFWGEAGLVLGDVSYSDFSGDTGKYGVIDIDDGDNGEFNDLLATSDPPRPRALTVFFVEEISVDGSPILGRAAGPPGIPTVHGTSKSGMAATSADLRDDPDRLAQIIAHEGAHFLGLFHTSEKDGGTHDPLSDTPECGSSSDGDGDGIVSPTECSGKGGESLMFWAPLTTSTDLSSDQAWVLQRNPAVQ